MTALIFFERSKNLVNSKSDAHSMVQLWDMYKDTMLAYRIKHMSNS